MVAHNALHTCEGKKDFFILSFDGGGWVDSIHFSKEFFCRAETRHFKGCLRVWSRGHQVRGDPCKLGKLALFNHEKNIIIINNTYIKH